MSTTTAFPTVENRLHVSLDEIAARVRAPSYSANYLGRWGVIQDPADVLLDVYDGPRFRERFGDLHIQGTVAFEYAVAKANSLGLGRVVPYLIDHAAYVVVQLLSPTYRLKSFPDSDRLVAYTDDTGTSWTVEPLPLPALDPLPFMRYNMQRLNRIAAKGHKAEWYERPHEEADRIERRFGKKIWEIAHTIAVADSVHFPAGSTLLLKNKPLEWEPKAACDVVGHNGEFSAEEIPLDLIAASKDVLVQGPDGTILYVFRYQTHHTGPAPEGFQVWPPLTR